MSHVFQVKGSRFWYAQVYDSNGRQHKVSTKCPVKCASKMETKASRKKAEQFLAELRAQKSAGVLVKEPRCSYEEMRQLLLADYRRKHNRSLLTPAKGNGEQTISGLKHLDAFFKGFRARGITIEELNRFVAKRLKEDANERTVNRNLALLRRMMNLAQQHGKIDRLLHFPMFSEQGNEREGFVSQHQFEQIRERLPTHLHPLVTFLHDTGVRVGEARKIRWEQVDLKRGLIVLSGEQTKNKKPRIIPLSPEISAWLREMPRQDPIFDATNLRKSWKRATKAVKLDGILLHDLRRSALRDLVRAGVNETVARKISGHRTRSVFDRYNITDVSDQLAAMQKLIESRQSQKQVEGAKPKAALPA